MNKFESAAGLLSAAQDILILTHVRPDGDTLGSAVALKEALCAMGKKVCIACSSEITRKYRWLTDGKGSLLPEFEPKFIVSVDVAVPSLLGNALEKYKDKINLAIDHHCTNCGFATENLILANSASTGEIVYALLKSMGVTITKKIADAICTAIITDTGCFRYSNTTASTLRAAAELYEYGADTYKIIRQMLEINTREAIEIMKLAVNDLIFYGGGKISVMVITEDMIKASGATDDDMEGLVSFPRNIEGVEMSFTVKQVGKDEFKISARSVDSVDVSKICSEFGGGGHKNAAACTIIGTCAEAEKKISNAAVKYLEENR